MAGVFKRVGMRLSVVVSLMLVLGLALPGPVLGDGMYDSGWYDFDGAGYAREVLLDSQQR